MDEPRFTDQHKRLSDFQDEVWVVCPKCNKQAMARRQADEKQARLLCIHCGFHKTISTLFTYSGRSSYELIQAAHIYFGVDLWFAHPFKGEVFWAYNPAHLDYLEQYISAKLREHKDRTHFTLLEKLPKFYHEARNRKGLLKVISKLREK